MDGANQEMMRENRGEMSRQHHRRVWLKINRGRVEVWGSRRKKKLETYFGPGSPCGAAVSLWYYSSPRLNQAGSYAGTSEKLIATHNKVSAARRLVGVLCFHEGKGTGWAVRQSPVIVLCWDSWKSCDASLASAFRL